ncbi:TauD/TfdA family dioxygenase [Burkholderia sp. FERM BP-3421]|uniref:TauD/TfdA family dioxygenase n=1 Tax=Burkholderia sp. FERM BP-3421 TaxID=1494466 RepID=UPI00235FAAF0|nr:TauD/TfdA family dioxygenase [Burkholderia sp. FERM BP-3421]WDD95003.1 TauD/TfdA family dioxygenase [Burkholderia sp. FERM BP-3421]
MHVPAILDCSPHADALEALRAELPALPRADLGAFFTRAAALSDALPAPIRDTLAAFRARGNEGGYLLLRGLPLDPDALPDTPEHWPPPPERTLLQTEAWVALIGMRMGVATGYDRNRSGAPLQDVFPSRDAKTMIASEHSMTSHGYRDALRYHTELAYLTAQPNYVALGCSRADHEGRAGTPVISVRRIVKRLSAAHQDVLRSVPLTWRVDDLFKTAEQPDPQTRLRLLFDNDDRIRYDGRLIECEAGSAAHEALEAFMAAIEETQEILYLKPGDVLVFDNHRTSHSRTRYEPRFDGKDRWLTRLFIREPGAGHAARLRQAEVVGFEVRPPEAVLAG